MKLLPREVITFHSEFKVACSKLEFVELYDMTREVFIIYLSHFVEFLPTCFGDGCDLFSRKHTSSETTAFRQSMPILINKFRHAAVLINAKLQSRFFHASLENCTKNGF